MTCPVLVCVADSGWTSAAHAETVTQLNVSVPLDSLVWTPPPPPPPWRGSKSPPRPPSPPSPALPPFLQVISHLGIPLSSYSFTVGVLTSLLLLTGVAPISTGELYSRRCRRLATRVRELEASLAAATEKAAAERRGRVRAQQVAIRKSRYRCSRPSNFARFSPVFD